MLVKPNEINLIDLLNDLKSRQKRRLVYLDFFLLFLINRFVFFNTFFLRGADANGWGEILIVVYFDARMIGAVVTAVVGGLVTLT